MNKKPINILTLLRSEEGYLLIVVTMIGLILAIIFGYILPDLHTGQQTRAMNNLNELRAYEAARKGINAVRLGMKDVDNFPDLIGDSSNGKGILWAISQLSGTTSSPKYDEYMDESGSTIQFVSGCLGIDGVTTTEFPNEKGELHVAVVVFKDYKSGTTDFIEIYHSVDGGAWTTVATGITSGTTYFFNFDVPENNSSDAGGGFDFKYQRDSISGNMSFSIGDNGTYRASGMWDFDGNMIDKTGNQSFLNPDNDGDGIPYSNDDNDYDVEVFVIVRSTGITVAPGTGYAGNKTDLQLISNVPNSHLPNPMRQVLEAGFLIVQR